MFLEEQSKAEWISLLKNRINEYTVQEGLALPPMVNKDEGGKKIDIPNRDFMIEEVSWLILCNTKNISLQRSLQNGVTGIVTEDVENSTSIDTDIIPVYIYRKDSFELHYKEDAFRTYNLEKCRIDICAYKNNGANIIHEVAIALKKMHDSFLSYNSRDIFLLLELSVGCSFLEEIAKIRSLRYLAKALGEILDKNIKLQIFASNSSKNKSEVDRENNLIRATIEIMAAALGGADGIIADSFCSDDKEISILLAQNIQHLLVHESQYGKNDNTVEGAYAIEYLTTQCVEQSWKLFLEMREKDGNEAERIFNKWCIEDANQLQKQYETLEKIWVGVNKFQR